ncbi:Uncharacterised protein [Mycobacteroides abscessus]|nr:Uncharacterised protein [Mycobacteroides abscessus]CPU61448.1 Uncharacterised protein [Mycobacteroides abscessus]CPU61971.1 Uncharacterised protein [Mycobacteroides abscessus]CPV64422.1 Uncharacterised protein [Mycobacteroides abscessus]
MTEQYTAYWNKRSGAMWVEPVDGGSVTKLATHVTDLLSAHDVLAREGFHSVPYGTRWRQIPSSDTWELAVRSNRTSLGDAPTNSPSTAHPGKETPMSAEDTIPVTRVYPLPDGEPVIYPHAEIDELDSNGDLRIVGTQANRGAPGFEYVVWREGSFYRAETRRDKRTEADETSIEVDRVDA